MRPEQVITLEVSARICFSDHHPLVTVRLVRNHTLDEGIWPASCSFSSLDTN